MTEPIALVAVVLLVGELCRWLFYRESRASLDRLAESAENAVDQKVGF